MNNLSWLIYAADVSQNISSAFGFLSFMVGLIGGVGVVSIWVFCVAENQKKGPAIYATIAWVSVMLIIFPVSLLTPSSKTIYMIAASEAGETIVTSPEAKEIFEDLKRVIKMKLKQELE